MRKTIIFTLLALAALPAAAQFKTPSVSQAATVTQTIGLTDVTVTYHRPGVKGRQIWGALVPYDKVWRTGANEATTVAFSDDVTINGQPLVKGTYSLHTIPNASEWTVVFNNVSNQWGSFNYDPAKDALRVKVKPEKVPFTEWLTFDFPNVSTDSGTLMLRWENVGIPLQIGANTTAKVLASARAAVAGAKPDDWRTTYRAASFAFDNGLTGDATRWLDSSLKVNENMTNLWLKARMQAQAGDKAAAVKTAQLALAKMTDKDSTDLAAEIRKQVDAWK
jgi:DUF2911 family protein